MLLCIILFFIPFYIEGYYEFTHKPKYKFTITYLFGLIKKEIDSNNRLVVVKNERNKSTLDLIENIQYFIHKGKIEKLYLKINIGLKDPAILGIMIGVVWAITNTILAYFFKSDEMDKIKELDVQVVPLFNSEVFELFFLCIIKVNLVYIIIAYIRFLKTRKGGDSIARASYRGVNENYNE